MPRRLRFASGGHVYHVLNRGGGACAFSPRRALWYVRSPETEAELAGLRRSAAGGTPFGAEPWQERTAKRLGLGSTLRGRGRPPKHPSADDPI